MRSIKLLDISSFEIVMFSTVSPLEVFWVTFTTLGIVIIKGRMNKAATPSSTIKKINIYI